MSLKGFDEECNGLWVSIEGLAWGEKQHKLGQGLARWARGYPLPANRLKELERQLYQVQSVQLGNIDFGLEQQLRAEFEEMHMQFEIFWHQRSRVNWISYGDRNTRFFHNAVTIRRRRNLIVSLQRDDET
jgi:hypothetical protein